MWKIKNQKKIFWDQNVLVEYAKTFDFSEILINISHTFRMESQDRFETGILQRLA
jgi:hypothetical protein